MWILPSSDIHLFLAADLPHVQDLRVFGTDQYMIQPERSQWVEHTINADCVFTLNVQKQRPVGHVPGAVTQIVSAAAGVVRVTAGAAPGAALFRMDTQIGSPLVAKHLLRVSTHEDVVELMAGQTSRTLFAGRADRMLTVYAKVPPVAAASALPQVVDLTGHACLRYRGFDPSIAVVEPDGRIRGIAPGTTEVIVELVDGRSPGGLVHVDIHVRPSLEDHSQARWEELSALSPRTTRRLFFLAEGYRDGDRFFEMVRPMVHHLMHDGVNKPFCYLRDQFHCVGIFLPSQEQGITVAFRILPGPEDDLLPTWKTWTPVDEDPLPPWDGAILLERDTIHGLCWGSRPSQRLSPRFRSNAVIERLFYDAEDGRVPSADERCLAPYFGDPSTVAVDPRVSRRAYIAAIVKLSGFDLADDDRVVFVIDDSFPGGVHQRRVIRGLDVRLDEPMPTWIAASWGHEWGLRDVPSLGPLRLREIHERGRSPAELAARIAHELAHTYQLADEYESQRGRTYQDQVNFVPGIDGLDDNYNTHLDIAINATYDIEDTSTFRPLRPDPMANPPFVDRGDVLTDHIRWNFHRIQWLSRVVTMVRVTGSEFFDYRIELEPGQLARWVATDEIFVRPRLTVTLPTGPRLVAPMAGVIFDVDRSVGYLTARMAREWTAPPGTPPLVMYAPVRSSDDVPARLIDRHVVSYLQSHGPFPKRFACTEEPAVRDPADVPPAITGYKRPSVPSTTIGLYEGSADRSCDIYRPTGMCRLRRTLDVKELGGGETRREIVPFCFVCMYVLVDIIDPRQHERLERDYPR